MGLYIRTKNIIQSNQIFPFSSFPFFILFPSLTFPSLPFPSLPFPFPLFANWCLNSPQWFSVWISLRAWCQENNLVHGHKEKQQISCTIQLLYPNKLRDHPGWCDLQRTIASYRQWPCRYQRNRIHCHNLIGRMWIQRLVPSRFYCPNRPYVLWPVWTK